MLLVLCGGCGRDSSITRLHDVPLIDAVQTVKLNRAGELQEDLSPRLLRRFGAIQQPNNLDSDLVRLGRKLYFEPLLSRTGKVSCNSCHPLDRYGTLPSKFSIGIDGKMGHRNAPTVYNTSGHVAQFWDGRAPTLAEQAAGPLANPLEMGMSPGRVVGVLNGVSGYRADFEHAFPGQASPITIANVTSAIAEFERGLVTPARWDRYLGGDTRALSPEEKEGARLFANLGCMVCHSGPAIGGTLFEKLGVFVPWPNQSDHGRREVTRNPNDDMVFKVPSLRNVARTGPYFHDGSVSSLDSAVRMMARHQLGVDLTEDEARLIAAWLGSLTGDLPRDYIAEPSLPAAVRP